MITNSNQKTGGCPCGAIRVTANVSPNIHACHCDTCRKWGGGPLMAVDCGVNIQFDNKQNISVFASSAWAERGFCAQCGSHLFYRLKETGQHTVPVGLFDSARGFKFDQQIFIDEKPLKPKT